MTVTALEYIQAELLNLRASKRDLFVPLPSPIQPNRNKKAEADLCRCEVGAAGKPQGSSNRPKEESCDVRHQPFEQRCRSLCKSWGYLPCGSPHVANSRCVPLHTPSIPSR